MILQVNVCFRIASEAIFRLQKAKSPAALCKQNFNSCYSYMTLCEVWLQIVCNFSAHIWKACPTAKNLLRDHLLAVIIGMQAGFCFTLNPELVVLFPCKLLPNFPLLCTKFTTYGGHDVIAITSSQKNDFCTEMQVTQCCQIMNQVHNLYIILLNDDYEHLWTVVNFL